MKLNRLFFVLFGCLLAGSAISCGNDNNDYIPPALEPDKPVNPEPDPDPIPKHEDGQPYDTYRGLVMAGYQGWFGTPDDGCSHGKQWYHYQEKGKFEPGVLRNSIDYWPDMREYEKTYTPGKFFFQNGTGQAATVYSAYDKSSVLLHFKWMQQYGLDGVFMQRFVGEVINNPAGKDHFDKVLENAMEGSNTYQRAICVMYDLGGFMNDGRTTEKVLVDAQNIKDKYQLDNRDAKQKFYLYEKEKPLIVLWGVGFNDNRSYSLNDIRELMTGLKEKGFSIMLGVPTYWRDRRNDALNDSQLHDLIKAADVIMPWFVGRYDNNNYSNFYDLIAQDIKWCKENKVGYAPLCFPGSSDRNMHPNNDVNSRKSGEFFWKQLHYCIKAGAQMLYIAMFDEIDEGTAIYKCLNQKDVPGNIAEDDYWVLYEDGSYSERTMEKTGLSGNNWCRQAREMNITFQGIDDTLPTDYYLQLTGEARAMLRGDKSLSESLPAPKSGQ